MNKLLPAISGMALAVFPLAVIVGTRFFQVGTLWMVLMALLMLRLLVARWFRRQGFVRQGGLLLMLAILLTLPLWMELDFMLGIRFYPVLAHGVIFSLFFFSLFSQRPLVERIARLREGALPPQAVQYARRATVAWAAFLFCNGLASLATALWAPEWLWGLYNGLISYALVALMFAAEYTVRQRQRREWSAS